MIFWKLCFFRCFPYFQKVQKLKKSIIFEKSYLRDFKSFFNNSFYKKIPQNPNFLLWKQLLKNIYFRQDMDFWSWWIFQFFLNLPIFKNLPKIEYSSDFFERQQSWKLGSWGIFYKRNYWKSFINRGDMILFNFALFWK